MEWRVKAWQLGWSRCLVLHDLLVFILFLPFSRFSWVSWQCTKCVISFKTIGLVRLGGPLKSSTMKCGLFPTCWSHPLRATNINKLYLRSCWPLVVVLPQPNELRKSPAPQWPRSGWNLLPPGGWQPRDSFAQGGVPSAALQIKKSDD